MRKRRRFLDIVVNRGIFQQGHVAFDPRHGHKELCWFVGTVIRFVGFVVMHFPCIVLGLVDDGIHVLRLGYALDLNHASRFTAVLKVRGITLKQITLTYVLLIVQLYHRWKESHSIIGIPFCIIYTYNL
jgi:hypothetical protein